MHYFSELKGTSINDLYCLTNSLKPKHIQFTMTTKAKAANSDKLQPLKMLCFCLQNDLKALKTKFLIGFLHSAQV